MTERFGLVATGAEASKIEPGVRRVVYNEADESDLATPFLLDTKLVESYPERVQASRSLDSVRIVSIDPIEVLKAFFPEE